MIININTKKGLEYFMLCVMNLEKFDYSNLIEEIKEIFHDFLINL